RRTDAPPDRRSATSTLARAQRATRARRRWLRRVGARGDLLVVQVENDRSTVAAETTRCQYWLQGTAVQHVARSARQSRDDIGRSSTRNAGGNELRDGRNCRVHVGAGVVPCSQNNRDLALRRLVEPSGNICRSSTHDLLEPLRELATYGNEPVG